MNIFRFLKSSLLPGILLVSTIAQAQINKSVTIVNYLQLVSLLHQDNNLKVADDPYVLPWLKSIRSETLWAMCVSRNVYVDEPSNQALGNMPAGKQGNLASILVKGVLEGKFSAQYASNEYKPMELPAFISLLTTGNKSSLHGFNPEQVIGYRIKEDWIYLQKEKKMAVQISGIAPLMKVINDKGVSVDQPVFWLYYSEVREYLASVKVPDNAMNFTGNMDQFLVGRNYTGKIDMVIDRGCSGYDYWTEKALHF